MHEKGSMRKMRTRARDKTLYEQYIAMRTLQKRPRSLAPRMSKTTRRKRAHGDLEKRALPDLHMLASDQLRILQNNLHKSRERTHGILNDPDTKQYTILLLQEQYWSAYTKSSPMHHAWTLYEPTIHNEQPRTAIY